MNKFRILVVAFVALVASSLNSSAGAQFVYIDGGGSSSASDMAIRLDFNLVEGYGQAQSVHLSDIFFNEKVWQDRYGNLPKHDEASLFADAIVPTLAAMMLLGIVGYFRRRGYGV